MCGVIGIYSKSQVATSLFYGMNSLQHRGQEATGMAIYNGEEILRKRSMGLVIDAYTEESLRDLEGNLRRLSVADGRGNAAVGHRYDQVHVTGRFFPQDFAAATAIW